jgi:diguanylate cyclase (GGDEF)-like protein
MERGAADRPSDSPQGQRLRDPQRDEPFRGVGEIGGGGAPNLTDSTSGGAIRVAQDAIEQCDDAFFDSQRVDGAVALRAGDADEQLALHVVGGRTCDGVREANGTHILRGCRIAMFQRVAQDSRRHRVPIAPIAVAADGTAFVRLTAVVQRDDAGVGHEGTRTAMTDLDSRSREHEAVVLDGTRIAEQRVVDRASERPNCHGLAGEDDAVNLPRHALGIVPRRRQRGRIWVVPGRSSFTMCAVPRFTLVLLLALAAGATAWAQPPDNGVPALLEQARVSRQQGRTADAVQLARRALRAAEAAASPELIEASLAALSASQEAAGDYPGALASLRRYTELHERQLRESTARAVGVDRRRFQWAVFAGSTVLLGLLGFGIYRRRAKSARLAAALSITDPLTGLKNRRYMLLTMGGDIAAGERKRRDAPPGVRPSDADLVFLLADLDRFKTVNDEFGHEAGDLVLTQVADVLRESCRASDTIARWGGDEFLVVSRFTDRRTAPVLAERIRAAIEERAFDVGDGRTIHRSCSVGIAAFPFSVTHPAALGWEQVIAIADQALHRAKRAGANAWVAVSVAEAATAQQLEPRSGDTLDQWVADGTATVEPANT